LNVAAPKHSRACLYLEWNPLETQLVGGLIIFIRLLSFFISISFFICKYDNHCAARMLQMSIDADIYRDCLRTLHSQAVIDTRANFVPNRVLGASPPDISPLENLLPRSVRTTFAQLRSGHCRLLNSYKARITSGISDVCPDCRVAPHSVEHLFNCQSNLTQLTTQDLWDDPATVADFLNLDN